MLPRDENAWCIPKYSADVVSSGVSSLIECEKHGDHLVGILQGTVRLAWVTICSKLRLQSIPGKMSRIHRVCADLLPPTPSPRATPNLSSHFLCTSIQISQGRVDYGLGKTIPALRDLKPLRSFSFILHVFLITRRILLTESGGSLAGGSGTIWKRESLKARESSAERMSWSIAGLWCCSYHATERNRPGTLGEEPAFYMSNFIQLKA